MCVVGVCSCVRVTYSCSCDVILGPPQLGPRRAFFLPHIPKEAGSCNSVAGVVGRAHIYSDSNPNPCSMDPLAALPAEIVLRILEFASISSIAALSRASTSWHAFIDHVHQDAIYAAHLPGVSPATTPHEYMGALKAFRPDSVSRGVESWKEACRRRCLLQDAWNSPDPMPIASVIQIGIHPVWRFKPDFDRRLIVSTSQAGGVNVTDMDTGDLLWSLGRHEVRPFAHLEYQSGTAVWVCL